MLKVIAILFIGLVVAGAHAAGPEKGTKELKTEVTKELKLEDIRCEKVMGVSLAEFKEKLFENCNLDKPYSSSLSKIMAEEIYFYCCQKK